VIPLPEYLCRFLRSAVKPQWMMSCGLLLLSLSLSLPLPAQAPGEATRIVLLGTGTPAANPERYGSALAIVVGDTAYLVDMGPGVVRRMSAARDLGFEQLFYLNHVFVTHLHSDHTAGFADLILTPWVMGRTEPLEVYGPVGIQSMAKHLLEAYQQDVEIRLSGLEPANTTGYQVNAHEIKSGLIYQDANVRVEAFPVQHGSWAQAFGFRFTTPDRTIVISGDTVPSGKIVELCNGCDVLVHEVYSAAGLEQMPDRWRRYHAAFHTSTKQLAALAGRAKPGLLILTHQLYFGTSDAGLLREVTDEYSGKVVSGSDLDIY